MRLAPLCRIFSAALLLALPAPAFADFAIQNGGTPQPAYGSSSYSASSGYATAPQAYAQQPQQQPSAPMAATPAAYSDPYAGYSAASPSTAYADPTAGYSASGYYSSSTAAQPSAASATAYPSPSTDFYAKAQQERYASTLPAFQAQATATVPSSLSPNSTATASYYAQQPVYPSYGTDPAASATPSLAAVPATQTAVYDPNNSYAQPKIIQNKASPDYSYAAAAFETNGYPPQAYAPQQQGYAPQGYGAPGAGMVAAPQAYGSQPAYPSQGYAPQQQAYAPQQQAYAQPQAAPYGSSSYGMSGYAPSYGASQPAPQAYASNGYAQGVYPQQPAMASAQQTYGAPAYGQQPSYAAADPMQAYAQPAYGAPAPYAQPSAPTYGYAAQQDYASQSYSVSAYTQPAAIAPKQGAGRYKDLSPPRVHVGDDEADTSASADMDMDDGDDFVPTAAPMQRGRSAPSAFYAEIKTGLSIPKDSSFSDTTNGAYDEQYKMGWEFGGAVGYSFPSFNSVVAPRLELEVSSHRGSVDEIEVAGSNFSDPDAFGDVNTWRLFANGYLDFNTPWRRWLTPWIGGGVGMGFADFDRIGTSASGVALSDSAAGFAYNATVGLTFPLWSPNSMIDLGYRYSQVLDLDLKTIDGTSTTADLTSHEFTLGFRQNFATGGMF